MENILKVPDISCQHCKMTIESALTKIEKVKEVEIDLNSKMVKVTGDADLTEVIAAIKEAGFPVEQT